MGSERCAKPLPVRAALACAIFTIVLIATAAVAQVRVPAGRGLVELEAKEQRREGNIFYADGDVDIHYKNLRLRADHVEYNAGTSEAGARGHVRFDSDTQSIEGETGRFNLRRGHGTFTRVHGSIRAVRLSNRTVLVSQNPFTFDAKEVERLDARTYIIRHAWVTVCKPDHAIWKFYTAYARVVVDRRARLSRANFRLLGVPILYLPYATVPLSKRLRQSGFLLPEIGQTTNKGFVLGDSFYWAPVPWADGTLGFQLLSRRGWSQNVEIRAHPTDDIQTSYTFYGVNDRGLPGPNGVRQPQGGHESHFGLDALLPGGWRAVADVNTLTSLTFRLAFAETFAEAVNSEVRSTAFVTNNFRGFSLNFYANKYKNFVTLSPETAVELRAAPGVSFGSVEQAPWKRWPVYFGFDVYEDAVHRDDSQVETSELVQRSEVAPRVTMPLRWGPWLGVTPTFAVRVTRYGEQEISGVAVPNAIRRTTEELSIDLRPPSFARVWARGLKKWKHVIEPKAVYRYVNGVNEFGRILRFDENDTLTDTNEVEYSVTQRLYRKNADGQADELVTWKVSQKYYFDPTFGGALVPGQRNVFQAVDSLSPFAFADGFRRFSPVVSDLRVAPHPRYDAEFRVDYDTQRGRLNAFGTLLKVKPYRESFLTLAHFSTRTPDILQPRSNQVRILGGYGEVNRPGVNAILGFSYDLRNNFLQNQTAVVSFNGSCCGLAFEFRRLALGTVRTENQFRVALLIANIGTFGNVRRQEKIF